MNDKLDRLSPAEKRQWFLAQLEKDGQGRFKQNIRSAIEAQDLSGIDLSQIDFEELGVGSTLSFRKCQLKGASFAESTLKDVHFEEANLEGADFSGATLIRCSFQGSNIPGNKPNPHNLKNVNFQNAILTEVKLWCCDLSDADFSNARINGSLKGSLLERANFTESTLYGVRFESANLAHAQFCDAQFCYPQVDRQHIFVYSNFDRAILKQANFTGVVFRAPVDFPRANLQGSNFSDANFSDRICLRGANLTDALMPETWRDRLNPSALHQATLPDGQIYLDREPKILGQSPKISWQERSSLLIKLIKQFLSLILWLILLAISAGLLKSLLLLILVYQWGIWSFGILPIILTIWATIVYNSDQAKEHRSRMKSWDFSFLVFGWPIGLFLFELPFIAIGLLVGNIPLLSSIFHGLVLGVPIALLFIYFLGEIIRGNLK